MAPSEKIWGSEPFKKIKINFKVIFMYFKRFYPPPRKNSVSARSQRRALGGGAMFGGSSYILDVFIFFNPRMPWRGHFLLAILGLWVQWWKKSHKLFLRLLREFCSPDFEAYDYNPTCRYRIKTSFFVFLQTSEVALFCWYR